MSNSFITSISLRLDIIIPPCHILIYLLDIIAYFACFSMFLIKNKMLTASKNGEHQTNNTLHLLL